MASPDITPYVDLTVYDQQPTEIYDAAVDYARVVLPEWQPVNGSIEDAILQSAAGVTGELLAALNRVPSSVLEALLQLFGITRLTGEAPTVQVRITLIDDLGHTIPNGTRFGYLDTSDTDSVLYVFETTADITVNAPDTYVDTDVVGILLEEYPALDTGQELRLLSGLSFVESIELLEDLTVGSTGETDSEYFTRAMAVLNSYSSALVLPDQFESYVLSNYSNVYRAKAYNLLDPADNTIATFTESPGYITVYACGLDGASLSVSSASAIVEDVTSKCTGGLIVNVEAPTLAPITVTTTVLLASGYTAATVVTAVEDALAGYIGPNSWQWGDVIYYNEVISLIDQVAGVDRVVSLSLAAGDANSALNGNDLEFVKYGSLPVLTALVTGQAY